ncbi:MAG: hypothetical protein KKF44_06230 [Nanoarchaeota archaeon]|nr:hypothetical protein [Nanoarchaeota archaeon]
MVSVIAPLESGLKQRLDKFPWVNWSEVARFEVNKRRIFEEYLKSRKLSQEDQDFCDEIDWHPVDELELKEEFVEKLKKLAQKPHVKMDLKKLDKLLGLR